MKIEVKFTEEGKNREEFYEREDFVLDDVTKVYYEIEQETISRICFTSKKHGNFLYAIRDILSFTIKE